MEPLVIPELSVVVLIGASGCGKSSFARKHFLPTEVVSSDACRGIVSDDENNQEATKDAFDLLHFIMEKRLERGNLVVVDATNVQEINRKQLVQIARKYHAVPVAIVLNAPASVCIERNKERPDRQFGPHVIRNQTRDLKWTLKSIHKERFRHVYVLNSVQQIEDVAIERQPLRPDRKNEAGPFDIIGDIHGCYDELVELLTKLGYAIHDHEAAPPEGRKAVFLGDLVDRGPKTPDVLKLVMGMVSSGAALCVPGNHDEKLLKLLNGKAVTIRHGLEKTVEQLDLELPEFRDQVREFLDALTSHYVLDDGRLVVAHAGMKREYQGRASGTVRSFAMYGETTGEMDEFGLPIRYNWAAEYRGPAKVVYGHTPVPEPEWINGTINIDTGCVFGGRLTALRYPEMQTISVNAHEIYAEPKKPFLTQPESNLTGQQAQDEILDLKDITGKRQVQTGLRGIVTIQEENSTTALEVMSRFAANPKWLMYLPPTMAPTTTTDLPDLLEHPKEGFDYFRQEGVASVVCEEKHMGSRAVVVLCRNEETARRRFGVPDEGSGIIYTRTGRRFFDDPKLEQDLLDRLIKAADATSFWQNLETDWVILDCELMPWSAKAQELLKQQYAAVGAASVVSTRSAIATLELTAQRGVEGLSELSAKVTQRADLAEKFVESYRRYCWRVDSLDDIRLAPFHILATEGRLHTDRNHIWHMDTIAELCEGDPILFKTPYLQVDLDDEAQCAKGIDWWTELTAKGGEGMVIKPLEFIVRGPHGVAQPAVKCRGREYLRIIYGPEYTMHDNIARLRKRGVARKRSLALREFALGIEGLTRFIAGEPLRKIHECVFGVLALESEPVDPRL